MRVIAVEWAWSYENISWTIHQNSEVGFVYVESVSCGPQNDMLNGLHWLRPEAWPYWPFSGCCVGSQNPPRSSAQKWASLKRYVQKKKTIQSGLERGERGCRRGLLLFFLWVVLGLALSVLEYLALGAFALKIIWEQTGGVDVSCWFASPFWLWVKTNWSSRLKGLFVETRIE